MTIEARLATVTLVEVRKRDLKIPGKVEKPMNTASADKAATAAFNNRTEDNMEAMVSETQETKAPVKAKAKKPVKAKAKKPVKAKAAAKKTPARKPKPTTGQSGPQIDLPAEELNKKEAKVLKALTSEGKQNLKELASLCFGYKNKEQSNSWVRNSLRRLVCAGLAIKVERGTYRATDKGRRRVETLAVA